MALTHSSIRDDPYSQANDQADFPFFAATISLALARTANISAVPEWWLEWDFAAGEALRGSPTMAGQPLEVLCLLLHVHVTIKHYCISQVHSPPNSSHIAISSTTDNATLLPNTPVIMSFLGTGIDMYIKEILYRSYAAVIPGTRQAASSTAKHAPYRVAPLSAVRLDGEPCEQLPPPRQQWSRNTHALQVEYTPVQYVVADPAARALYARRTEMLVRLRNVGNLTVPLDRVVLRYWLAAAAADVLNATCLNATTGVWRVVSACWMLQMCIAVHISSTP